MNPCIANPHPYDVLIDITGGPEHRAAVAEAQTLCNGCEERVTCLLRDHAAEPWAQAITGRKLTPTSRPTCGGSQGVRLHGAHGEEQCEVCRAYSRRMNQRKVAKRRAIRTAA